MGSCYLCLCPAPPGFGPICDRCKKEHGLKNRGPSGTELSDEDRRKMDELLRVKDVSGPREFAKLYGMDIPNEPEPEDPPGKGTARLYGADPASGLTWTPASAEDLAKLPLGSTLKVRCVLCGRKNLLRLDGISFLRRPGGGFDYMYGDLTLADLVGACDVWSPPRITYPAHVNLLGLLGRIWT